VFDEYADSYTQEELLRRINAFVFNLERLFGSEEGSFEFVKKLSGMESSERFDAESSKRFDAENSKRFDAEDGEQLDAETSEPQSTHAMEKEAAPCTAN
jgi:hypothetical protein